MLLRATDVYDLVPQYSGSITNTNGDVIGNVTITQDPQSSTNYWTRFDRSIFATYSFLGIGWDAVSQFNPNVPLVIMMVLFSVLAVIVILNVLIGKYQSCPLFSFT